MEKDRILSIIGTILFFIFCIWALFLVEPAIMGQTYNESATVNVTVNITNAAPSVREVTVPDIVNLIAYNNYSVECNFTVYDYDNNTQGANATLHFTTYSPIGTQDLNFRYFNPNCTRISPVDYYTNYSCNFSVMYFANNGTWLCNATGVDSLGANGKNASSVLTITPLVAIKLPGLMDYGQLQVGRTSNDTIGNITNAGNRDVNISVQGYATTIGDGLAMNCSMGSIAVNYERYDTYNNSDYDFQYVLTSSPLKINNFYVPQRTNDALESINKTYWKIKIPPGAGGICNGKLLFTANDRGN